MKTIKPNPFWTFAYNTGLIPESVGVLYLVFRDGSVISGFHIVMGDYGFLNPLLAAFTMASSFHYCSIQLTASQEI